MTDSNMESSNESLDQQGNPDPANVEARPNDGAPADDDKQEEKSPNSSWDEESSKDEANDTTKETEDVAIVRKLPSLMDACEDNEEEEEDDNVGMEAAFSKATMARCRHSMGDDKSLEFSDLDGKQHEQNNDTQVGASGLDLSGADTPPPAVNRRRHTIQLSSAPEGAKWNSFVRKGARLKNLLDNAIHKVATIPKKSSGKKSRSKRPLSSIDGESPTQESPVRRRIDDHAAELAREKIAEVTVLKMKLKEAEAHAAAMSAANATLREAASASSERMERTAEALRIAGTNAANARADADAAEANAAALSNQLQALKSVVDETKRATQILYTEHEQVSAASHSVETKLLQTETENGRLQKEKRRLVEERDDLMGKATTLEETKGKLETRLNETTEQLDTLKRALKEREAVEQARIDRTHQIEKELRETRAMLVEASATSAETETTMALLNDTIDELRRENKSLHERMEGMQDDARKEHERLSETLNKAQCDAQQIRIKSAADNEEMDRLRLDKTACEAEITRLKNRITSLERRLKDASIAYPSPITETPRNEQDEAGTKKSSISFSIPPLGLSSKSPAGGKENKNMASNSKLTKLKPSGKCCLCYKDAFGLMKSCQCGNKSCNKRAHAMCLAGSTGNTGPSVSHPGTPAPRLPVVLCGNVKP